MPINGHPMNTTPKKDHPTPKRSKMLELSRVALRLKNGRQHGFGRQVCSIKKII